MICINTYFTESILLCTLYTFYASKSNGIKFIFMKTAGGGGMGEETFPSKLSSLVFYDKGLFFEPTNIFKQDVQQHFVKTTSLKK